MATLDPADTASRYSISARMAPWMNSPPEQFFDVLLDVANRNVKALAGQVWGLSDSGRLVKIRTSDATLFEPLDKSNVVQRHRDLLSQTLFSGEIKSTSLHPAEAASSNRRTLMLVPLKLNADTVGVLELILADGLDSQTEAAVHELQSSASSYLLNQAQQPKTEQVKTQTSQPTQPNRRAPAQPLDFLSPNQPPSQSPRQQSPDSATESNAASPTADPAWSPSQFEDYVWQLHRSTDAMSIAATAVNETRRLLGCDRVGLALVRGSTVEVVAISGQDSIATNSNSVRALQAVADHVYQSGQDIDFEIGNADTSPPSDVVLDYLRETEAIGLRAIPLIPTTQPDFDQDPSDLSEPPFGVLVVEQFSDNSDARNAMENQLPRLLPHLSQAVDHGWQQQQILLLPTRQKLGRLFERSKVTRSKLRLIGGALLLSLVTLCFFKTTYQVEATGKLVPSQQYRAYAPLDGEVQQVFVTSGQPVQPGQPLVRLHDEELATRLLTLQNRLDEKKKLSAAYRAQMDEQETSVSSSGRIALSAKIAQNVAEMEGLQKQLELAQQREQRAVLRSNIAGSVATFRPDDLLSGRPVRRGELLIEVMDQSGGWSLELELPAKRFGHLLESATNENASPTVSFVLATQPEQTWHATLEEVATRATTDEQGRSIVLLRARIADDQKFPRNIGADVIARIDCGRQPLGYVWFGDIIDWFRML